MTDRYRFFQSCLAVLAASVAISLPAAAQAATDIPNCASPGIVQPTAANTHVADEYPLLSVVLGEQGDTILDIVIQPDGSVGTAGVAKSSGSLRLDDAAVDTVQKHWRYHPAQQNSAPIACRWKVEVHWVLHKTMFANSPDNPGMVIKMKPEDYPADARTRGEQGAVALVVLYSEDGKSQKVHIIKSSGYPDLDAASTTLALARLRAGNATYDGKPVKTVVMLVMVWAL
jgi:TonB family protein